MNNIDQTEKIYAPNSHDFETFICRVVQEKKISSKELWLAGLKASLGI